jgi:hypothetical protein
MRGLFPFGKLRVRMTTLFTYTSSESSKGTIKLGIALFCGSD